MNFKHAYNFVFGANCKEKANYEPSLTVPDMAMTVKQLLQRVRAGSVPKVMFQGTFEEEPSFEFIDPTRSGDFDLSDLTELQLEIDTLNANIKAAQDALNAKKNEEVIRESANEEPLNN